MRKFIISTGILAMTLGGVPLMSGCERTVSDEKTVKETPSGGTKVEEKKVTENTQTGEIKKTETKDVHNP